MLLWHVYLELSLPGNICKVSQDYGNETYGREPTMHVKADIIPSIVYFSRQPLCRIINLLLNKCILHSVVTSLKNQGYQLRHHISSRAP